MENVADRERDRLACAAARCTGRASRLPRGRGAELDRPSRRELGDGLPTLPVEGGTIKVSIEDAQSRFNLNSIGGTDPASLANLQVLQRLLDVLHLDPQLANAVADWIDTNSEARAEARRTSTTSTSIRLIAPPTGPWRASTSCA